MRVRQEGYPAPAGGVGYSKKGRLATEGFAEGAIEYLAHREGARASAETLLVRCYIFETKCRGGVRISADSLKSPSLTSR